MKKLLLLSLLLGACSTEVKKPDEVIPVGGGGTGQDSTPIEPPVKEPPKPQGVIKVPSVGWKYQIMDEDDGDYVKQLRADTKLVNIELFGTDKTRNANLHAKGIYVVCYYSLSYEAWRPDAKQFPEEAKGSKMQGWNELWPKLDKESLHVFMDKRDDLAVQKGCDAVEIDNMDNNNKGAKSIVMNALIRRANHAHSVGLALMAKNTGEYSADISKYADGVFIEECEDNNECDNYLPWKGKFTAMIEYSKSDAKCLPWAEVHYHSDGYFTGNYGACR